jgi:phage gpG-like protein
MPRGDYKELTLTDLSKLIERYVLKIGDLKPLWDRLIPLLHNRTMSRFALAGPGWAQLAPSTIAGRIREGTYRTGVGGDQPILQREGDLRRSLMAMNLGGDAQHIEVKLPLTLIYGTNMKKAIYLQGDLDAWQPGAGGSAYATKLPPRPFLYLDDTDIETILTQCVGYLEFVLDNA